MEDCVPNSLWILRVYAMHCGLTNAPAPFQRFMSGVLKDVCVVIYLDDILIYSDDQISTSSTYVRSCTAFMQAPYAPKSRSALSAWTRRTTVSLLALTAFEWIPRRSKLSSTVRHQKR